ncbi:MAG TPA: hypothetical protein VE994_23225, partial [Terriglobales bacterium]|nr:hypothetical protein [Terriglobales bacterium]
MRTAWACSIFVFIVVLSSFQMMKAAGNHEELSPQFHTSDRCLACHNGLITSSGQDISIGIDWRSSVMANSARDPYWQASVRRETIDHAESNAAIQDECTVCHMPITRYLAKQQGKEGQAFAYLPFNAHPKGSAYAEDGVTCSVCHQITKEKLGTRASFNGGFSVLAPPSKNDHPEYGPFEVSGPHQHIMETSTQGFVPTFARHIRDAALCGTCHQLYTTARGAGGKDIGYLPEQMPYLEWLHSDFPNKYTCQECHMPEVHGAAPITAVLPVERNGVHQHVFVGGNFFLQRMLNLYRNDLNVAALPQELTNASNGTIAFLQSQAARVSFRNIAVTGGKLQAEVLVENLTGHKLPTAFPSRRAWLHFLVKDRNGRV